MTPALLLPAGLAALLALAIPLVIHIARRTESRTIAFAALRWLEAMPKPRRSLTLDERLLLAARLVLLALLALWLARPVLWNAADDRPVVAVIPGVEAEVVRAVREGEARGVWLAPGFPEVGGATPDRPANPASLIRQLDAELPAETRLTVLAPPVLDGIDAERPIVSRRIDWRVVGEPEPARPSPASAPPALSVRHDAERQAQVRYFRAAALAWAAEDADPAFEAAPIDRPIDRVTERLVWLADTPPPGRVLDWVRDGGVILTAVDARMPVEGETAVVWRDAVGEPLAVAGRLGRGRVIRLMRPLEPAAIPQLVEADFPDALMRMLRPAPPPARVAAAAHAPIPGAAPYDQPPLDLRPWLALLVSSVFLGERWLATRRRRGIAP